MNIEKFKALVHYICHKCGDPSILGKTKLNKVLYFSDFATYRQTGEPLTGETYVKAQFGPVPRHIDEALQTLIDDNAIVVREAPVYSHMKKEFIALKGADLTHFTADEIAMVDGMIDVICYGHSAKSISEASHNNAWKLAEIGEEIPYKAVFAFGFGEVNDEDVSWAMDYIAKQRAA